jgi:hypothetical protein
VYTGKISTEMRNKLLFLNCYDRLFSKYHSSLPKLQKSYIMKKKSTLSSHIFYNPPPKKKANTQQKASLEMQSFMLTVKSYMIHHSIMSINPQWLTCSTFLNIIILDPSLKNSINSQCLNFHQNIRNLSTLNLLPFKHLIKI